MLSRIFWVGIAAVALLTGIVLQDGDRFFRADRGIDIGIDRAIDRTVDHAVDGSFDGMQVMDADGNEIDVPTETKRALGEAVAQLVKAKADLAILKVRDASDEEIAAAEVRSAQARAEVDRLKVEIRGEDQAADRDAIRAEVRREIRDTVREAVRN